MSKKYKFRLTVNNWLQFTEKDLKNFKDVTFVDDGGKGKIIPVKRDYDGQVYDIIVPLELIEECENE
jgi:hypothetical protein